MVYNYFNDYIGSHVPRSCLLNLSVLGWQPRDLNHLDLPFTHEDIKNTIMKAPKEKALGPDGFIEPFFSHCWEIIKEDIVNAVNQIYSLNQHGMHFLIQAFVVLIPKKENSQAVSDFRPISLTHSFAKIITKLLAKRLAPVLDNLISYN
jgi:hypothetical protein